MRCKLSPSRLRRVRLAACVGLLALIGTSSALASDAFSDVPNGAPFHNEITIFKATNITAGCTATTFCPQDPVKRQAMAAFIDRALGLVIRPGESTFKAVPGSLASRIDDDVSSVGTSGNALYLSGPSDNVVGGFSGNVVRPGVAGAVIAGGGSAGSANSVTDHYSAVVGGLANQAGDDDAMLSDAHYASVVGGYGNLANGPYASVIGGSGNTALGIGAIVAGGSQNTASAHNSFAAGTQANATHQGSFVWADRSNFFFGATANNEFSVRSTGGVRFVTAVNGTTGAATAGVQLTAGANAWTTLSDRGAKRDFARVDKQALLRKLAGIPIESWGYRTEPRFVRHIGPYAQDFARTFGLGSDNRRISTVDADGVALAAIQGLYATNVRLDRRNSALEARVVQQNARLAALERTVAVLARRP